MSRILPLERTAAGRSTLLTIHDMIWIVSLRLIPVGVAVVFQDNIHLPQQVLELLEDRLPAEALVAHLEQEAHADLALVRIDAMLCNDFIVGCEEGAKRESLNVGLLLRAGDDLVKEADIYNMRKMSRIRLDTRIYNNATATALLTLVGERRVFVR